MNNPRPPAVEPSNDGPGNLRGSEVGTVVKSKGGAPRGNRNSVKHLHYAKLGKREEQRRYRRVVARETSAILSSRHLDRDPLAVRIGRRLTEVEVEIRRLAQRCETLGRFDRKGQPLPHYTLYLRLQEADRAEVARLLDRLDGSTDTTRAELTSLILSSLDESERPSVGAPFPFPNPAPPLPAASPRGADVTSEPPALDAGPRSAAERRECEAWERDDDEESSDGDAFDAPPPIAATATPAPVAARPTTPRLPAYRLGIDAPRGSWRDSATGLLSTLEDDD